MVLSLLAVVPASVGANGSVPHAGPPAAMSIDLDVRQSLPPFVSCAEDHDEDGPVPCGMLDCTSMSSCTSTAAAVSELASLHLDVVGLAHLASITRCPSTTPRASLPPPPKV